MCYIKNDLKKQRKTAIIPKRENRLITSYEGQPQQPKGNIAVPPFYGYCAEDAARIKEALSDGCSADALGSFAAWLSHKTPMHAWQMSGKRYDIGDMQNYENAQKMFWVWEKRKSI